MAAGRKRPPLASSLRLYPPSRPTTSLRARLWRVRTSTLGGNFLSASWRTLRLKARYRRRRSGRALAIMTRVLVFPAPATATSLRFRPER